MPTCAICHWSAASAYFRVDRRACAETRTAVVMGVEIPVKPVVCKDRKACQARLLAQQSLLNASEQRRLLEDAEKRKVGKRLARQYRKEKASGSTTAPIAGATLWESEEFDGLPKHGDPRRSNAGGRR